MACSKITDSPYGRMHFARASSSSKDISITFATFQLLPAIFSLKHANQTQRHCQRAFHVISLERRTRQAQSNEPKTRMSWYWKRFSDLDLNYEQSNGTQWNPSIPYVDSNKCNRILVHWYDLSYYSQIVSFSCVFSLYFASSPTYNLNHIIWVKIHLKWNEKKISQSFRSNGKREKYRLELLGSRFNRKPNWERAENFRSNGKTAY